MNHNEVLMDTNTCKTALPKP